MHPLHASQKVTSEWSDGRLRRTLVFFEYLFSRQFMPELLGYRSCHFAEFAGHLLVARVRSLRALTSFMFSVAEIRDAILSLDLSGLFAC
jgi:hypothetical protein